jgi:hypothetical protein
MTRLLEVIGKAFRADPVGASMLVDEAVSNWMLDECEAHADVLQARMAADVAIRNAIAKRALAKSYVEVMVGGNYPDDEVHKTAQWLAGIDAYTKAVLTGEVSKAFGRRRTETWYMADGSPVSRQVSRDASGKFTRFISGGASSNVMGLSAKEQLSPHLGGVIDRRSMTYKQGVSEEDKAKANKHQAQWEQAKRFAEELEGAYGGTNTKGVTIDFHILGSDGNHRITHVPIHDVSEREEWNIGGLNPLEDTILSATLAGGEGPKEQAAVLRFNTMGAVGDTSLARFSGAPGASWADAVGRGDPNKTAAERFFTRLKGGGEVLSAVPGGEKYGNFARLVGAMGPEAEATLGPHVRQAAYRYRGTEKAPDVGLVQDLRGAEMRQVDHIAHSEELTDRDGKLLTARRAVAEQLPAGQGGRRSVVAGSAAYRAKQGRSGDQLAMEVTSDTAAQHLMFTLPRESITAELSEASGHVLPSQGVLLNHKGEVVSQSVGFADDHYLPFNLKNLGALRGGQYVRTRVSGGLTGEDIYASVNSGARMATVVSGSGVFSLELDPSFRGARGNSDKARSMYQRYLKILDAVDASGLYLQDLTGPERAQVHEHVQRLLPKADRSSAEYKAELETALEQKRRQKMAGIKLEEVWGAASNQANAELKGRQSSTAQVARRTQDIYEEMVEAEYEEKGVQKLTLNGQGYAVALQTLQQQFPYFIRNVSYEPLPQFQENREQMAVAGHRLGRERKADTGYVRPGGLRPESARSGFYETGTSGALPGKESKKPGREAPAPAGQQGKEPGVEAGGGQSSAAAASAAPKEGGLKGTQLGDALKILSTRAKEESDAIGTDLGLTLSGLKKANSPHQGKSWDTVRNADNQTKAEYLMEHSEDAARLVREDPGAATALMDAKAVAAALGKAYDAGLDDELQMRNEGGGSFAGGAQNREQLTAYLVHRSQALADAATMTDPFAPVSDPMRNEGRPQAYQEFASLGTPQAFKSAVTSDLAELKAEADALFPHGPGGYMSVAQMREVVTPQLTLFNKLASKSTRDDLEAAIRRDPDAYTVKTLATSTHESPEAIEAVLGGTDNGRLPTDWDVRVAARAERLQKAWALRMTERSLELAEGGGALPKAGAEGQFLRPEVAKASSSRRVRVLPPEHALSKALVRARSTPRG